MFIEIVRKPTEKHNSRTFIFFKFRAEGWIPQVSLPLNFNTGFHSYIYNIVVVVIIM